MSGGCCPPCYPVAANLSPSSALLPRLGVPLFLTSLIAQFVLALAVIFLVLIHSGKGGGLSDMFGGGLGAAASGSTVMEKNLDRITVVVSLVFAFNTVILSLLIDR